MALDDARLRAVVLRNKEEYATTCPYATELRKHGYAVETYFDCKSLLTAINAGEISVVVIDALGASERRALIDELILAVPYHPPRVLWITGHAGGSARLVDEFQHELGWEGGLVRVIIRGDMPTFTARLGAVREWLNRAKIPTLTILYGKGEDVQEHQRWFSDGRLHHEQQKIVDALIDGTSLRRASRHPKNDHLSPRDLYTFACLAGARKALGKADLASAVTEARGKYTSENTVTNCIVRIRKALTARGLPAKEIVRTDDSLYRLDRTLIRIKSKYVSV